MTMKRKVASSNPNSADDLNNTIKQVWLSEITQEYCKRLVHSMPRRIASVLLNKGGILSTQPDFMNYDVDVFFAKILLH